jgi:hypothetical protein
VQDKQDPQPEQVSQVRGERLRRNYFPREVFFFGFGFWGVSLPLPAVCFFFAATLTLLVRARHIDIPACYLLSARACAQSSPLRFLIV